MQKKNLLKLVNIVGQQIAMIKVAIQYHKHPEKFKNEFDEKYFQEIAEMEGVPKGKLENTRLMCIYLKDADSLDMVRFENLDVSYLRTSVAKSDIFLREYGKSKEDIQLDNAGLAVKRNADFNLEQELSHAVFSKNKIYNIARQEEVAMEDESSSEIMREIERTFEQQKESQNPILE